VSRSGLLVVNTSSSWGGNEHWAVSVARGMAERGHPVRFLWSHDPVGERVKAAGLDNLQIRLRSDSDLQGVAQLRRQILEMNATAVVLTKWREYLLGGLAARLSNRPRVVLRLGLRMEPKADVKRRLVFGLADKVIVNAPEIRQTLVQLPWIDPARISVVINGTELGAWHPSWTAAGGELGRAFRQERGIAPGAPLVVNVGHLTGQKDHATLLRACQELYGQVPGLRVLIFGEGPLREDLQGQIDSLGLGGVVTLAGILADVASALAAADLFILSSRNEGMARALVEAAASGLPIVTTAVSGAGQCVEDGASGQVVPVGDAEALARAAAEVLADPDLRQAMGRRARALAEERFSVERMLDETEAVVFGAS
jgi:glycosyltransferase involved in cell wall biosynthesis